MKCNAIIRTMVLSLTVLSIIGCASAGNQKLAKLDNQKVVDLIQDGKTKKAEVELALGKPNDVDYDALGNEKCTYLHVYSKAKASSYIPVVGLLAGGTNDTHKKLVVIYDKNNVVAKHFFSIRAEETKIGVFS